MDKLQQDSEVLGAASQKSFDCDTTRRETEMLTRSIEVKRAAIEHDKAAIRMLVRK